MNTILRSFRSQSMLKIKILGKHKEIKVKVPSSKSITYFLNSQFQKNEKIVTKLPKNMSLSHCIPSSDMLTQNEQVQVNSQTEISRPLIIIMSWMFAEDKHIEIYRQLWLKRGFDVLTVKTSPIDLLLPLIRGKVLTDNTFECLSKICPQFYDEIIIQTFSVGIYLFGEMNERLTSSDEYRNLRQSLKGLIIDSPVHPEDIPPGLSRVSTNNRMLQKSLEMSLNTFFLLTRRITFNRFKELQVVFNKNPLRLPALVLYSTDDVVNVTKSNEEWIKIWRQLGIDVQIKCWTQSKHVMHYKEHQSEYEQELDQFLSKLKLSSQKK